MSESTRRRRYRYDRIVIESARILSAQFDDAVLFFTGAQVELMRNVTGYLRRLETYTAEYHLGYYLTPTADDYDDLLAIVADLEETLMGNPNTLFGYETHYEDISSSTVSGAGDKNLYFGAIPAGTLLRLEGARVKNTDTACTKIVISVGYPGGDHIIAEFQNPGANVSKFFDGMVTLPAATDMKATFYGCQDGDHIVCTLRGYNMDVPE